MCIRDRDYTKPVGMWQYTNQLVLNGRKWDGDLAYKEYPALTQGEEEEDMTQEEVVRLARAEAQKVFAENQDKYKTLDSVPAWARGAVEQVYQELGLQGTGGAGQELQIDAGDLYVRVLTVIAKVLDKLDGEEA